MTQLHPQQQKQIIHPDLIDTVLREFPSASDLCEFRSVSQNFDQSIQHLIQNCGSDDRLMQWVKCHNTIVDLKSKIQAPFEAPNTNDVHQFNVTFFNQLGLHVMYPSYQNHSNEKVFYLFSAFGQVVPLHLDQLFGHHLSTE